MCSSGAQSSGGVQLSWLSTGTGQVRQVGQVNLEALTAAAGGSGGDQGKVAAVAGQLAASIVQGCTHHMHSLAGCCPHHNRHSDAKQLGCTRVQMPVSSQAGWHRRAYPGGGGSLPGLCMWQLQP